MGGRFVAIGDSFTEGVGDPNLLYPNGVRGWADRMARQLGRADGTWQYANFAIRSKRLDEVVAEQLDLALALKPTLLTFYAGGNDILAVRVDMDLLIARYEEALRRLTGSGAQVVVFTIFQVRAATMIEPLRRRIELYNSAVHELGATYGALVFDHNDWSTFRDPHLWSFDRLHMSKTGHKHLAGHVLAELGLPHTLKLRDPQPAATPPLLQRVKHEERWWRTEVIPLVRRRINGVREGDALPPKWPELIHPSEGMKRLAREKAGDAREIHSRRQQKESQDS